MARSVLIQLARDSIQEVIEAKRTIDRETLLSQHPLLEYSVATTVNLYLDGKLRGSSSSESPQRSLLEDIVYNAKVAAFQSEFGAVSTAEYLACEVEVILHTEDEDMREKDPSILKSSPYKLGNLLE